MLLNSLASTIADFLNKHHHFTTSSDKSMNDEDPRAVLQFYKEFNLLVTEILSDITDYMKKLSQTSPTQANINKLKLAVQTLSSLKRSGRGK
jgi:hypothetical protein